VPYPMLMTFDAPDSNTTCTRRERSDTPLQALVTLNDPVYWEASEALAARMMKASANLDTQLQYGAHLVLSRGLTENELSSLRRMLAKALRAPESTKLVRVTAGPKPTFGKNRSAMNAVAGVLLNLDAALIR